MKPKHYVEAVTTFVSRQLPGEDIDGLSVIARAVKNMAREAGDTRMGEDSAVCRAMQSELHDFGVMVRAYWKSDMLKRHTIQMKLAVMAVRQSMTIKGVRVTRSLVGSGHPSFRIAGALYDMAGAADYIMGLKAPTLGRH